MGTAAYRLRVPEGVAESIRGMHPHLKKKIRASLKIILTNPLEGKPLKEELKGLVSFRVSRFRIIYRIKKSAIEIVALGPRNRIYEETLFLVKKREIVSGHPHGIIFSCFFQNEIFPQMHDNKAMKLLS